MNKIGSYAKLVTQIGLNVQKGQNVVIQSPIETAEFARMVMEESYNLGAREVVIRYIDEKASRIQFLNNSEDVYDEFPKWMYEFYMEYVNTNTCFLSISASDPDNLTGIDLNRLAKWQKISSSALASYREKLMANENVWCVISLPTIPWAKKVFPNLSDDDAVNSLWDKILEANRCHLDNPVLEWENHINKLSTVVDKLNNYNFKSLHYFSNNGTNFEVELVKNHIWAGGAEKSKSGIVFAPNMPTEEVFTMPNCNSANGKLVSTKPLAYNGNIIEDFWLEFKNGKVVSFDAKVGKEVLKELLSIDSGACMLGEVALVENDSPISNMNILFYNTLFDENASCHFAFGKSYSMNIKNASSYSDDDKFRLGINDSLIHEDFMIGTSDMEITGTTYSGELIKVFSNGNFVI